MKWLVVLASVTALGACGNDPQPAPRAREAAQGSPAPASNAIAPSPVPAELASVDLLRAIETDIVVSSVYRNDIEQALHLADADPRTAWNARSGELLESWIEIHLPNDATLTSIQLTAGFTNQTQTADLFTGNQRLARVRVRHNGTELGVYPLDPESRELQTLPVQGDGGVYRIEVVELRAGTRANWREVCVSELRVMGRAPSASAGRRFPHFHVATRSPRAAAPATGNLDQHFVTATTRFARELRRLEREMHRDQNDMAEPGLSEASPADYRRRRYQLLQSLGASIESMSAPDGDAIRALTAGPMRDEDLEVVAEAIRSASASVSQQARCSWSLEHIAILLSRVTVDVALQREIDDMDDAMGVGSTGPDLSALQRQLEALDFRFEHPTPATVASVRRVRMPELSRTSQNWAALLRVIEQNTSQCGW